MRAKLCAYPGCGAVVPFGQRYCARHEAKRRAEEAERVSASWAKAGRAGDYHSAKWRELKRRAVASHPYCARCGETRRLEVHHIRSVRLHPELMLDEANLMVLCHSCHALETRREIEERRRR